MSFVFAGIFNVSNKLFVTLDVLFDMRSHIRRGEPPHNCAASVFERLDLTGQLQKDDNLTSEELRYLKEKLYDGYFAFEALTRREWDSAICGICGIAPVFESGDGNCKNCVPLRKGQVNTLSTFCVCSICITI